MASRRSAKATNTLPPLKAAEKPKPSEVTFEYDDDLWAARSEHWLVENQNPRQWRAVRERSKQPLILSGHGVSLRIEGGSLAIRNGFTHYPQKQETYRFFKGEHALPPRIIMLDGNGSLSFDVIAWLSEQNVPLIRIDWQGNVQTVLASNGYAANAHRLRWQKELRNNPRKRLAFCIDLIIRKIDGCIKTLEKSVPRSFQWERAMKQAYADLTRLECNPPDNIVSLRSLEGGSAAAYFKAWRSVPLQWTGLNLRPVPESWKSIGSRSSLFTMKGNRSAVHPVNAMLNYAYAILESQIRIEIIAEGYDPTIGMMHESREGTSAFVFDLMEPERPRIDHCILEFVRSHKFHGTDFVINSVGVCRLNPEMARVIADKIVKLIEANRSSRSTATTF